MFSLIFRTTFIVDQVENYYALVEWEDMQLSVMPLELLPTDTQEGDRMTLEINKSKQSNCFLDNHDPIMVQCPLSNALIFPVELDTTIYNYKTTQPVYWRIYRETQNITKN